MDATFHRLCQTSTTQHFYHRTPPPSPEELRFFGLKTANNASKDVRCTVCRGRVQDPVETKCNHTFCFACIYEWLGASTSCPRCERDIYHTRKLRKQPSRDIHPADRDVPHRFSSSEWIRATNTPPGKAFKKQTADDQLLVNKARKPTYLEVPMASHQHTHSDRAASASYQHRKVSFAPDVEKRSLRCGRYSLPSYESTASNKYHPVPYQQYSLDSGSEDLIAVGGPGDQDDVEVLAHLDPTMIDLISTCSTYLEREQQAAEENVRFMCVDSEAMISNMWAAHNSLGRDVSVPIRCRAIAKCVWREWQEYLKRRDGSLVMDEELFWGLHANFEKTVVDYGWVDNWRKLPTDFVDLLERTMAVATQT